MDKISILPMDESALAHAYLVAHELGFVHAIHIDTSELQGLYCMPSHPRHRHGVLVNTVELGLIFVATLKDMQLPHLAVPSPTIRFSTVESLP